MQTSLFESPNKKYQGKIKYETMVVWMGNATNEIVKMNRRIDL